MAKKIFLSILVLAISSYAAAQTFDNASACSVVNLEPILEEEDINASIIITPQQITYYNCDGTIDHTFIQYELGIARKALGMSMFAGTFTINGDLLCLIKVLAQKTLNCMDNGGSDGLMVNGSDFQMTIYERKKGIGKGWNMTIRGNDNTVYFNKKSTYNVVKALSQIETE